MLKKMICGLAGIVLAAGVLTACDGANSSSKAATPPKVDDVSFVNFTAPEKGEEIAVMTVKDFGTVKIKLFPEIAPKGVENFKGLIDLNYYDELIFHRVIKDFMIQGGDPKGNGTGGNSMWGTEFDLEPSEKLPHFTGAVAYAHAAAGTNGSQFYIVSSQAELPTEQTFVDMYTNYDKAYPENVKKKYEEVGGVPHLDGDYTVFGQVFEGQDVVDAIASVKTVDPANDNNKPANQVLIEKIEIVEYQG